MEGPCWREAGGSKGLEAGGGVKEDYEGPAMRGLLLEPEKVCRKSVTHSGYKPETQGSFFYFINNRKLKKKKVQACSLTHSLHS